MKTTIRSLGASGEGIGETEEGKRLFLEGALPGETVTYSIEVDKKSYAKGKLLTIEEKAKERVQPPCPVFGQCGGCQLQHLSYEGQLEAKRQRVVDALLRIAKRDVEVKPTIPSPMPYHYRNKIQLPHKEGVIGLFKKKSHEIVPIKGCAIQCATGEKIFAFLRKKLPPCVDYLLIRTAIFTNEALVVFICKKRENLEPLAQEILDSLPEVKGVILNLNRFTGNRILGPKFQLLAGQSTIEENLGELKFRLSAPSFFQINSWQAAALFEEATKMIQPDERVIDAFCGVGTLALFAAKKARSVYGIECVAEAIRDAKQNAELNGIANCHFEVGFAEAKVLKCDTLLLNPPRKGLNPAIFEKIDAKKIAYISCDPATLSRDLAYFKNYSIDSVQPFDLFPQTMHIETVLHLSKLDSIT